MLFKRERSSSATAAGVSRIADHLRADEDDELGAFEALVGTSEQISPRIGSLVEDRHAAFVVVSLLADKPPEHHHLPAVDRDGARDLALGDGGRQRRGRPSDLTTALISCSMSMVTRPVELTRGITLRITPVSRNRIELTIGRVRVFENRGLLRRYREPRRPP